MSEPNTQPPSLLAQAVAAAARHALTAGAAVLGAHGVLSTDQQTQFVSVGVALTLAAASYGWSLIQKRNAHKGK